MISTSIKTNYFRIVIIGRPNVGKSTLFNRLLRKRRAITDSSPGVTRDSVEAECKIGDRVFLLIDTGGFTLESSDYSELISAKSLDTAKNADLILFMVDMNEITGDDLAFIERIRPFQERTILIINKVDNTEQEDMIWNLYELGFNQLIPVSALHGRNISRLEDEILLFVKNLPENEGEKPVQGIRIAILGKPNTGKSTLTNYLLGEDKSLVSEIPGTTRDVIEGKLIYQGISFKVLDTAGIRRKRKVKNPVEYYSVNRAIKCIRESDIVFLLIDITEDISDQDKKIASHAVKHGKGIIFVLNKWDLLPRVPNRLEAITDKIRFFFPVLHYVPVLPVSAISGSGVKELLQKALQVWKQLNTHIETVKLNKMVKLWNDSYHYKVKGRKVKIRYAVQESTNPVRFIVFLSRNKGVRREFLSYIKNKIKSDVKLDMVPVDIEFR
ncbi:MAG: ribosome biogenesis GTPase Der [Spirochaetales bacterium]|nr:ribosome biogenesis GTPase Der [Spirochaetales bacterium]